MKHRIEKTFQIEAAHRLPNLPPEHKCSRLHGHSFKITVVLEGPLDPKLEWVQDYGEVKKIAGQVIDPLDHNYLNDIDGLENPTSEVLAAWVAKRLKDALPLLKEVRVAETCTSAAVVSFD